MWTRRRPSSTSRDRNRYSPAQLSPVMPTSRLVHDARAHERHMMVPKRTKDLSSKHHQLNKPPDLASIRVSDWWDRNTARINATGDFIQGGPGPPPARQKNGDTSETPIQPAMFQQGTSDPCTLICSPLAPSRCQERREKLISRFGDKVGEVRDT